MSVDIQTTRDYVPLWIGNRAEGGAGDFEVRDPGRPEEVVATVAAANSETVDRAVAAAQVGGSEWASQPLDERIMVLRSAVRELTRSVDDWAAVLACENGALLREARLDLERGLGVVLSSLDDAETYLRPTVTTHEGYVLHLEKVPVGVVGLIVPWNSPIVLALAKVGPALVAGNSVIAKPSTEAPVVLTRLLVELAGYLPAGVLNVVNGSGMGSVITNHPGIRKISFTGSTETGREVMRDAATNLKRIDLELGGNDAAVLLDDVDLDSIIVPLCQGVFTRAGQVCFAVKRIYAPQRRFDEIHEAIREVVGRYRVGHGLDPRSDFGPLINRRQVERLQGLIERTRAIGANIETLGNAVDDAEFSHGAYMLPTVVTGIPQRSELVEIEPFGPVVPILPYDDVDEAVALANDSEFGLASSVWSSEVGRAVDVARRLEAGVTFVNSHNLWSLSFDVPFGGVKQSGIGRERTALGLQEYIEEHAIRVPAPTSPAPGVAK